MRLKIKYNSTSQIFDDINIIGKIGEGKSGLIYKISDNYVIKILKNGNRFEYDFYNNFLETLKEDIISLKIGLPLCYGRLLNNYNDFTMKNKFLIFKKYKKLKLKNIKGSNDIEKILSLISNLLKVENYLEKKIKYVNLDIKADNVMLDENNNIKVIDLGLIKKFTKGDMFYSYSDYIIWPNAKCYLDSVPLYSTFIVVCMLHFSDKFIQENNIIKLLKTLKKKYNNNKLNKILNLLIKKKYDSQYVLSHF